jgi:hypothetical protein
MLPHGTSYATPPRPLKFGRIHPFNFFGVNFVRLFLRIFAWPEGRGLCDALEKLHSYVTETRRGRLID